jgi:hypothetical protein
VLWRRDTVIKGEIVPDRGVMQDDDKGRDAAQPIEMRRPGGGRFRRGNFL